MHNWRMDKTEFTGGVLMVLVGIGVIAESLRYGVGDVSAIGPGFFPRALGVVILICGIGITGTAFLKDGPFPQPNWRALFTITAALVGFAVTVRYFGLLPAIVVLTALARLAEPNFDVVRTAIIAACLSLFSYLIFVVGLDLPFSMLRWPS